MDLGLTGKVAMALAAAGGLGAAVARQLAAEGAQVSRADAPAAEPSDVDVRSGCVIAGPAAVERRA